MNREILKEGNSLILTINKSITDENNRFKRLNVQKIGSLTDLVNKPIKEVTFKIKSEKQLIEISNYLNKNGDTLININLSNSDNNLKFKLENKRNLDRKTLNLLRNKEISAIID